MGVHKGLVLMSGGGLVVANRLDGVTNGYVG